MGGRWVGAGTARIVTSSCEPWLAFQALKWTTGGPSRALQRLKQALKWILCGGQGV